MMNHIQNCSCYVMNKHNQSNTPQKNCCATVNLSLNANNIVKLEQEWYCTARPYILVSENS